MKKNKEGQPCEFYVTPAQQGYNVPPGFSVIGGQQCPRNLSPQEKKLANPDGVNSCPPYNLQECARAFSEEAFCPTRAGRRPRLK